MTFLEERHTAHNNLMGIFRKLFGTYSERQLKRNRALLEGTLALSEKYAEMPDEELQGMTAILKERLAAGESLDDILPDAFATVREADFRVLGKKPFPVQVAGGILLHQGRIAEMKTGEGKTLVATLPAYLNALVGEGVHIVTVNDYLARCGSEEMGRVYAFLGMKTGLVVHGQTHEEKRAAYAADITYGTNNEFGFDYLRDNMVLYKERMVQRGHRFAIVDEVDSILIDEARTPLIISGEGEKSTEAYDIAERFVRTLRKHVIKELDDKQLSDDIDADYVVDEKARSVTLTKSGIAKAEAFYHLENLADPQNSAINHHINQAIRAHGIMQKDVDYMLRDGEIIIIDSFTGRLMPGRRYNNGLHQAIEAKEHVDVQKESKTLATITFQNYFRMYKKLSGMTGTALTEDAEFREIYRLDVIEVPTNKPMIRVDHNDAVYRTVEGKYRAVVNQILECHKKGQPVLVGTVSVEKSEMLSRILKKSGIPHNVLNAKYHEKEAEIVAAAGKAGAVTISTNMAGRGTDIMLGGNPEFMAKSEMRRRGMDEGLIAGSTGTSETTDPELISARELFSQLYERYKEEIAPEAARVRAAGGLFVLGTERHESRRIDNQLRGRSGRQGDPGESRFYLSLDDDLMRLFCSDRVVHLVERLGLDEDTPIGAGILSGSIESAQRRIEGQNFSRRKNVIRYDDVMNEQRKIIYDQRGDVLNGSDLHETIRNMILSAIRENCEMFLAGDDASSFNTAELRQHYLGVLTTPDSFEGMTDKSEITEWLEERAMTIFAEKEALFGADIFREVERTILLRNVDSKWMDHLNAAEELRGEIGLASYAQRDPVVEYKIQTSQMFDEMVADIRENTVRMILTVVPRASVTERTAVAKVTGEGFANGQKPAAKRKPTRSVKIGRNEPCPCGSGKKYKKCCGAGASDNGGKA